MGQFTVFELGAALALTVGVAVLVLNLSDKTQEDSLLKIAASEHRSEMREALKKAAILCITDKTSAWGESEGKPAFFQKVGNFYASMVEVEGFFDSERFYGSEAQIEVDLRTEKFVESLKPRKKKIGNFVQYPNPFQDAYLRVPLITSSDFRDCVLPEVKVILKAKKLIVEG
jgi:hypothetical protein